MLCERSFLRSCTCAAQSQCVLMCSGYVIERAELAEEQVEESTTEQRQQALDAEGRIADAERNAEEQEQRAMDAEEEADRLRADLKAQKEAGMGGGGSSAKSKKEHKIGDARQLDGEFTGAAERWDFERSLGIAGGFASSLGNVISKRRICIF